MGGLRCVLLLLLNAIISAYQLATTSDALPPGLWCVRFVFQQTGCVLGPLTAFVSPILTRLFAGCHATSYSVYYVSGCALAAEACMAVCVLFGCVCSATF